MMKRFAIVIIAALVLVIGQITQTVVVAKVSDRADKIVRLNTRLADTISRDDATIKGLSETVASQSTAIDRQTKAISAAADILGKLQGIDGFLRDNWPPTTTTTVSPAVASPTTAVLPAAVPLGPPPPAPVSTTTTIRTCSILQLLGVCI